MTLQRKRWAGTALLASALGCCALIAGDLAPAASEPAAKPRVVLTADQDHALIMKLRGVTKVRPGADPNNPKAPNVPNYDESKATPYPTLPQVLTFKNGEPVKTVLDWRRRRLELLEDFDREVYGRTPEVMPAVVWKKIDSKAEKMGAQDVITTTYLGKVDNHAYPSIKVEIEMLLTTPAAAKEPVPVVLSYSFPRAMMSRFPKPAGPSWQEQMIAKGWGSAEIYPTSYQADNGAGLTDGIIGLVNKGQPRKLEDWGALKAWAWGASRALDCLEKEPRVNSRMVGIEGLSRYGKTALVTMAYDERFAIGFIGSSGCGGAKILRRDFGERVENLTSPGEYHWMGGNFVKYGSSLQWKDLPVDAHELIALCAPRPVFIGCGAPNVEGQWVDQKGTFLAAVAAGPVYRLLGAKDLGTTTMPGINETLISGDMAWRQHEGGHTNIPNWPTFLEFASRYAWPAAK